MGKAYHEAGHAILQSIFGMTVMNVSIRPATEDTGGYTMKNENGLTGREIEKEDTLEESLEVCGQQLKINKRFKDLLDDASLTISDLNECAQRICQWMQKKGWFRFNHTITFVVDQIPRGNTQFLFVYKPANTNNINKEIPTETTGIICAYSYKFREEVASAQKAITDSGKKDPAKILREMLHLCIGFKISHEMCHAFGINYQNGLFKGMELEDLELLTDCSAYASCSEFIGEGSACLGAPYIQEALKKAGDGVNADSVKRLVARVIANPVI
jgi:hypothetical protein